MSDNKKYSEEWLKGKLESNRPVAKGQVYWWMTTIHGGKTIVLGYKLTEDEAYRYCYQKCKDNYKITPLTTRDMNKAVRQLKGQIFSDTADLDEALEKFRRQS